VAERFAGVGMERCFAGQALPSFDDHIDVAGVQLDQPGAAASAFSGD
jgi:hypothetical protein